MCCKAVHDPRSFKQHMAQILALDTPVVARHSVSDPSYSASCAGHLKDQRSVKKQMEQFNALDLAMSKCSLRHDSEVFGSAANISRKVERFENGGKDKEPPLTAQQQQHYRQGLKHNFERIADHISTRMEAHPDCAQKRLSRKLNKSLASQKIALPKHRSLREALTRIEEDDVDTAPEKKLKVGDIVDEDRGSAGPSSSCGSFVIVDEDRVSAGVSSRQSSFVIVDEDNCSFVSDMSCPRDRPPRHPVIEDLDWL